MKISKRKDAHKEICIWLVYVVLKKYNICLIGVIFLINLGHPGVQILDYVKLIFDYTELLQCVVITGMKKGTTNSYQSRGKLKGGLNSFTSF